VGGEDGGQNPVPEGWLAAPGTKIVRETNHRKYNTRDQIDERLETEQVHHLGPISHKVRLIVSSVQFHGNVSQGPRHRHLSAKFETNPTHGVSPHSRSF